MHERGAVTIILSSLAAVLLCVPLVAAAHASGVSWEREINGYRIDIGYDPNAQIRGASDVFDFTLYDVERQRPVEADELWVRLVRDGRTVLATGLKSDPVVRSTLLYAFEQEGDYVLHASFRQDGETLAEGEFPFAVALGERSYAEYAIYGMLGLTLVLSAGAGFYIGRARH